MLILSTISGLIESLWRRWFGGWAEHELEGKVPEWFYKIMSSRGTQTIFNLLFLTAVFLINDFWAFTPLCAWLISLGIHKSIIAIVMSCIVQFLVYSKGHGTGMDLGRDTTPSESTIKRYQEVWFVFIPNKIIPKEHWYGFAYDFIWMWVRYTYGFIALVPFVWNLGILWIGLIISSMYALCNTIAERDNWIFKLIPWNMVKVAHQLGELLTGFLIGFWLMFM